jgi:hypothetical protein
MDSSTATLAAAACGACAGLGAWLALAAIRSPGDAAARSESTAPRLWLPVSRQVRAALAAVMMAGVLVAAAVRVPVLAVLAAGVALVAVEALRGPSVTALNQVGAGIASWCEVVRQELVAGQPQRTALFAACAEPPPGLEGPVSRLGQRLESASVPEALWAFAADVRHPAAGNAVAALDVAYRLGAGDLPRLMAGQVEIVRHAVQVQRELHAARARHRRAMLLLLGLFGVVISVLFVVWPDFLAAYRGLEGQAVLATIGGAVLLAVRALIRLSQPAASPDFYTADLTREWR